MWTLENRAKYNRDHLRYPSDLTDDEWMHVEPLIPPAKPGGGKRRTEMRTVMNGVMYILSTGCQWPFRGMRCRAGDECDPAHHRIATRQSSGAPCCTTESPSADSTLSLIGLWLWINARARRARPSRWSCTVTFMRWAARPAILRLLLTPWGEGTAPRSRTCGAWDTPHVMVGSIPPLVLRPRERRNPDCLRRASP
jgi:transposase